MKYFFRLGFYLITLSLLSCDQPQPIDVIIKDGLIYDGSAHSPVMGAIGIDHDTIVFVGEYIPSKYQAAKIIDADGRMITPGFIDPHTHAISDLRDTAKRANLNYLFQGVTTVFVGNDGRSSLNLKQQFDTWEKQGIGTNAASYVGHSTLRRQVMGMRDDPPTADELAQMKAILQKGMKDGALGFSSGLYYAPASYANTQEVIELAKVAAAYDGIYDVHMRDESTYNIGLVAAVKETIEIAEKAGLPGHIAHIKCLGVDVWGQSDSIVQIVKNARAKGLMITADQYPYRASGSSITGALIPRWVLADDPDPRPKFDNPQLRQRIIAEMKENMRRRGGPETLLLTFPNKKNKDLKGMTLAQVAQKWQVTPIDAAIEIFMNGGSAVGSFNMHPDDMATFMQQPWVMTGSDGSSGHPRKYGSFPKKLANYVLKENWIDMDAMIHRSSGLTATVFKLHKRGFLRPGYYADILVFNPEQVVDQATFEEPTKLAEGMSYVFVNGQLAIDDGQFTGQLAGRALRQ